MTLPLVIMRCWYAWCLLVSYIWGVRRSALTWGFSQKSSPLLIALPEGHPDSALCAASACHTAASPWCTGPGSAWPDEDKWAWSAHQHLGLYWPGSQLEQTHQLFRWRWLVGYHPTFSHLIHTFNQLSLYKNGNKKSLPHTQSGRTDKTKDNLKPQGDSPVPLRNKCLTVYVVTVGFCSR